jgi:hypothetical protein
MWTIITPSNAEQQITGWIGAVEKTYRNRLFRFEAWAVGQRNRCFINGKPVAWNDFTNFGRKLAHQYADFLKSQRVIA